MPFASRRQQRWAFANKKPFAKRWAKETPSFAALPESKDAGTTAGAPLHGPGGLLGFAGLRRRMKATKITGNLYRGDTGQFQAGGAGTSSDTAPTRKPPAASSTPTQRRKPAKTEQERAERRQGDQQARDDARAAQRTQNRADVLRSLNIAPDGTEALDVLRRGEQPDAAAIARAGFVEAGLVEQAADGSYRMTPTGRALLSAADSGDRGRAGDTISGGRDRVSTRRQRQQAAAERKKQPPKAAAGGGGGKEKPAIDVAGRMQRINARLAKMRKRRNLRSPEPIRAAPQKRTDDRTAPQGPLDRRQTMKAQAAEQKAMFAKMGGGGSGGGKGGGGKTTGGGVQSTLWAKGPDGKRIPQAGFEGRTRPADPGRPERGTTVGNTTKAYGADPNTSYSMRHELVDMDSIQASNTASGAINPKYDPSLQPRDRSRASSQAQITEVARKLNPDVLTTDFHRIDAGSPIIDKHGNVLSGNGRTLALQRAGEMHPEKLKEYRDAIKAQAREAGIDPATIDKMKNPVLVRRLQGDTDPAAFAREANSSGTLRMSPLEQAKVDASSIGNDHMLKLHVTEGQDIDRSLRDKNNKAFVADFLSTVPANERANLLTRDGDLNQMGLYRIKAAVYTRAFPGTHGERMAESMLESLDPDVKQIQTGISGGLPALSRAQSLIHSGQRERDLDISEDLAKTIDVYARIKDNPALTAGTPASQLVRKYLDQSSMFGRELNDEQERMLVHIDSISRSPTKVRSFLERYARIVENEPQPGQSGLFGEATNLTRAQLLDALFAEDSTTKAAMKAKRDERTDLPLLPPVRKRTSYGDIKTTDLVMALFHDQIAPNTAMREGEGLESFTVYKSSDGTPRWLARTTTAYRDRDREIIAIKALDADSQRMTAAHQYGPLRFWHLGKPDPLDASAPWGPGLDVGDCDFSTQIGTTRVESGTFKSAALARRIAETAGEYELSPGFFHPPDQPGADGVFSTIRTFERSLVPIRYGRASNLFTGLTVKGVRMDPDEMERRFKAAIAQLQLPPEQAAALSAGLIQADKSAQQQGIAYKSDNTAQTMNVGSDSTAKTITINGITYKAEQPAYEPPPDVVINGVTYKAMPPEFADEEEKADFGEGEAVGEEMADMGMDDGALIAAIADAVVAKIAPLFGDMKLSEMKAMFATKDDSRAQQVAQLEAALKSVQAQIAQLTGDQPKIGLPDDIAAALKSGGPQAPPDPNAPQIPADASPLTQLAARLAPQLYSNGPGGFNGWTPPVLPQS